MWLDELKSGESWMGIWKYKFHCGKCFAIIKDLLCPFCDHNNNQPRDIKIDHSSENNEIIPMVALMGAIDFTTHTLLELIKREWERPLTPKDQLSFNGIKIPQQLIIVLLFWTLFEHLMDTFFVGALRKIPKNISEDLLKRYNSIGSRMDRLYKILFKCSIRQDLIEINRLDIYEHLMRLQEKRNEFLHGNTNSIDQDLINNTILYLQDSQDAWIMLFNKRCADK